MLAAESRKQAKALVGSPRARIAPPVPLRHGLPEYHEYAAALDIVPMPWQDTAAKYLTANGADKKFLYREVAVIVGRQNGKTTLTKPLIVQRLKAGRHIMHIAQVRELPRIMFEAIADALEASDPGLFPRRRGKIIWPRRGAGSESIVLTNGGTYRIAAAVSGSSRGHSIDDLIIDELRQMTTWDVVNSAKPAQRFSEDPQTIYLSNMGDEDAVVLNSLRLRAGLDLPPDVAPTIDQSLAYLEWSADPEYGADDRRGWVQSNPAIGHYPQVLRDLEKDYVGALLGGNLSGFESEALCRRVPSMADLLVTSAEWDAQEFVTALDRPRQGFMGVKMDLHGERASAVVAAVRPDRRIALDVVWEATGSPIEDFDRLRADLQAIARENRASIVGYDPYTDADIVRQFRQAKPIIGRPYAAASGSFSRRAKGREFVIRDDRGLLAQDLEWTVRRASANGSFIAARANDQHTNTTVEAAIRAVALAAGDEPTPTLPAMIY
jgi:hypothetical protein